MFRWLRLLGGDGQAIAAQARPLLFWPDGSLKWVLVDWLGGDQELELVLGEGASDAPAPERPVAVGEQGGTLKVRTPEREYVFQRGAELCVAFELQVETESGQSLRPVIDEMDVLDRGPGAPAFG